MQFIRISYLIALILLASTQVFLVLSPWICPPLAASSDGKAVLGYFFLLFWAWIGALALGLALAAWEIVPLSVALSVMADLLVISALMVVESDYLYFLYSLCPPAVVLLFCGRELIEDARGARQV